MSGIFAWFKVFFFFASLVINAQTQTHIIHPIINAFTELTLVLADNGVRH